jgi:hypothetical protein
LLSLLASLFFSLAFLIAFLTASFIALTRWFPSLSLLDSSEESLLLVLLGSAMLASVSLGVESVGRGAYRLAPILLGLGDPINLVALIFVRVFKVLRSKDLD